MDGVVMEDYYRMTTLGENVNWMETNTFVVN